MSEGNDKPRRITPGEERDWHALAEKASHESDPKTLIDLVQRLCHVLDEERAARSGLHSTTAPKNDSLGAGSK